MKNRYEVRVIITKENGTDNRSCGFCDTLVRAKASVFLTQVLCAASDIEGYMLKIIDTKTNKIVKTYEG
nr:MAG TPA: hypothetical protein [Caudoviricetes sp.]